MILCKNSDKRIAKKERPIRTITMKIEEMPERPVYTFNSNKERYKYVVMVKMLVRNLPEYRDYISFLKTKAGMGDCAVFTKLQQGNGKKYRIELHHTPFTLEEIINVVVSKRQALGETLNAYKVAEEVLDLHYTKKVGLKNLSVTAHELAENGRIFIPLQQVYQRYDLFVDEYEEYMDDNLKSKISMIIEMSRKCDQIVSDILDPEFVYVNIDGFEYPEVPESWGKALKDVSLENTLSDQEKK